jgi:hypothetical protein
MSDFLELILARSYGEVPGAVGPRPVARFELPDHTAPEAETPPAAAPQRPPPAVPPVAAPVAPSPPTPPTVMREQFTTHDQLTIRGTRIGQAPAPPALPAEPMEREAAPSTVVKPMAVRASAPRDEPPPAEAEPRPPAVMPPLEPSQGPAAIAPLLPRQDEPPSQGPAAIAPLLPRQDEPPPTARSPAPVVHVRIGRVELHGPVPVASPPRPPAPRSAPASARPVRSLDEYLRRRNEERR